MLEVRVCFDALLAQYPTLKSHIDVDSPIVSNTAFENGLVSLQKGTISTLDERSKLAVKRFEVVEERIIPNEDMAQSLVLKALHDSRKITLGGYMDTSRVCPTSNHLERLFSQCKLIRSQLRQRMFPGTLEMLLFLKSNRILWSVLDAEAALNSWTGEDLIVNDIEEDSE